MCDYTIESLDSFIMATCFLTKTGFPPSYPYIFLFYVINIKRKRDGGKGQNK